MKAVLKKILGFILLPFILAGKVLTWPFRRKKAESIPPLSAIEQIAAQIEEEDYSAPRPKAKGPCMGRYAIGHYGLSYEEYKKANLDEIRIRNWSSMPDHSNLIRNRWRWRLGKWTQARALKEDDSKEPEKVDATDE